MTAAKSRSKDIGGGVSFSADDRQLVTMDGSVPVDRQSRQPSGQPYPVAKSSQGPIPSAQKPQPGGATKPPPVAGGGKGPGQLKKADSTVGNKTPPKKVSVAQGASGPTSRKTSLAAKPASSGGGKA